jgi:hypothetical protein
MLIVSCTKCDGWIVVVADSADHGSAFAIAAREEARKPDRKLSDVREVYDERAFGLTGACRASYGQKQDCTPDESTLNATGRR